jgi:hypothetical protein
MNKSLSRSIGFWLLLVVSLIATAIGGWLIASQIGTMTTTLLDGTATGIEVYVGQSLVVVGAGVLAAGIVGILLTLGLVAARSLVPVAAPVAAPAVVEPIDWSAQTAEAPASAPAPVEVKEAPAAAEAFATTDETTPETTTDATTETAAPAATSTSAEDGEATPPITR